MQSAKVIVLGDSGVGKTCILLRYIYDEFHQFNNSTVGASFLSKVQHISTDQSLRFQIWDTAGQERYKSIAPIYYRDSRVAICVYDIASRQSFVVLKNWVQMLKSDGPKDIIMAIVGNKIDLVDNQQVPYNQGKEYASEMGALFKLTSAKDNKGIQELFAEIAEAIVPKNKQVVGKVGLKIGGPDETQPQGTGGKRSYCCRTI